MSVDPFIPAVPVSAPEPTRHVHRGDQVPVPLLAGPETDSAMILDSRGPRVPNPVPDVIRVAAPLLPTPAGEFRAYGYRCVSDDLEHLALVLGNPCRRPGALVRIHSECLTGDVFSSRRCDCGEQLHSAIDRIATVGCGVLVYLRGHEGRGIGLAQKLRAYELQAAGLDTVDANLHLGFPADGRDYGAAAAILRDLGVTSVRLLTNNPDKILALRADGIRVVERIPSLVEPNAHNAGYLATKAARMHHALHPASPVGPRASRGPE